MAETEGGAVESVDVVMLVTRPQLEEAAGLLWEVWGARTDAERNEVISRSQLLAFSHSGNYVAGAYRRGRMVGCTVGFFGAGQVHSYLAGVVRSEGGRGVGYAMKRHQRQFALDHGIETITWTFDPLVARNAYFNLCKLGATVVAHEVDFYGRLDDGANTNQHTDRLLVEWNLRAEWVEWAMAAESGAARRHACVLPEAELIFLPEDIGALRRLDPEAAHDERLRVRDRFESLLGKGYLVAGMSRRGEYVLLPTDVDPEYES